MYDFAHILALNIKHARNKLGISQMELSLRSNISLGFINSIENEQKWVSPKTLAKLCEALEMAPHELFIADDAKEENLALIAKQHKNMITDIRDILREYTKE